MKLWTAQYRYNGRERVDITARTGSIFAPAWNMVMGLKSGLLSEDTYKQLYTSRMERSIRDHRKEWVEFLRREEVTIVCFCKAGAFCHRYLVIPFLSRVAWEEGIPFEYMGERR